MTVEISKYGANTTALPTRQRWEAPAIILGKRSLQVSAQDGAPGGPGVGPNGFLGPLSSIGRHRALAVRITALA